ncbi:pre-toxin TG domain-containing protein [Bacillus sp. WMMC1349]|uniref:pre-toxin TG domain-containing protein n=1 Tax=Bacillus sp. WMMC1349 TaxID=2736254 RepID=UPI0035C8CF7B
MADKKKKNNELDSSAKVFEASTLIERADQRKALDGTKTFVGEASGYYDYKRAKDGVDPVTGEKLTAGQRAAAGFIPVVGWAGRAAKGAKGVYGAYKAGKAISTADKALTAYKTTATFNNLQNVEIR